MQAKEYNKYIKVVYYYGERGDVMAEMNTSSWKEFRLDELFDIETTQGFDKNKIEFADDAPYDFIGRTSVNWGKQGSVHKLGSTPNPKNTFSLVQIGETIALWRENEWYASQNIFLLCPKINRIKDVPLYFWTIINKEMSIFGKAYNSYPTLKSLHDTYLKLPVTSSGEIDWQYMQERIAELEHYLVASGLNDYELTEEDKSILETELFNGDDATEFPSENGCRKEAREFKISDVFDLCKGKRLIKSEHIYGNTPFIGSSDSNNGVTGYIGQEPIFTGNAITISYNGSVGQVFYQENDFWASDDINVLYLKNHALNALLYGYLSGALKKAGSKFSYSYKWNLKRMKETLITLPIQTDTDHNPIIDPKNTYHPEGYIPDWSFMEKYIRAVEKVVIKDVVDWKDEEIKKTKELVS